MTFQPGTYISILQQRYHEIAQFAVYFISKFCRGHTPPRYAPAVECFVLVNLSPPPLPLNLFLDPPLTVLLYFV